MTAKIYPFKFLDSYTAQDKDIFFGRDTEIQELYEMVFQSDLILVYGASGTGKSSLIQCGLANKFKEHDWLPLPIRRGQNLNQSLEHALVEAMGAQTQDDAEDDLDWFGKDASNTQIATPVSALAKRFKALYLQYFRPIYLIFDQFEELYILGTQAEQQQFVMTVQEILRLEQPVKIIFSIREEYLGYLYEFERVVPELLRKKLRIEPMNIDKVRKVIGGIATLKNSLVDIDQSQQTTIADRIFDKIKGEGKSLSIQLPYLQVFLDKYYLTITGDEQRQTEATFTLEVLERMGDIGNVLTDFLNEQVQYIADTLAVKSEKIWEILSPFVTLEGTKEPLHQANISEKLPEVSPAMLQQALHAFVDRRILRMSEDTQVYEVAHDSLAKQIALKRTDEQIAVLEVQRLVKTQTHAKEGVREYFTEKQLNFIEPYLNKFVLSPEEQTWIAQSKQALQKQKEAEARQKALELAQAQKRLQRTRLLLGAALVGLIIAILAGIYAWQAQNEAKQAAAAARAAEQQALKAKDNVIKAQESQQEAVKQTIISSKKLKEEKARAYIINAKNMINLQEYIAAKAYLDSAQYYSPQNKDIEALRKTLK